jgi:hypothetical protein
MTTLFRFLPWLCVCYVLMRRDLGLKLECSYVHTISPAVLSSRSSRKLGNSGDLTSTIQLRCVESTYTQVSNDRYTAISCITTDALPNQHSRSSRRRDRRRFTDNRTGEDDDPNTCLLTAERSSRIQIHSTSYMGDERSFSISKIPDILTKMVNIDDDFRRLHTQATFDYWQRIRHSTFDDQLAPSDREEDTLVKWS